MASDLYKNIPLQIRTFLETILGDTSPITSENLSAADLGRIEESIKESRKYKQGLLDAYHWEGGDKEPSESAGYKEYKKYFPNQKALNTFEAGSGNVDYQTYQALNNSNRGDVDMSPSASVMNTLGRFPYNLNEDGSYNINETYDFKDDHISRLMPQSVSQTNRYDGMSNTEKLGLVAKETFVMPEQGFNLTKGIASLPSRVGSAFVGESKSRPVNINFTPTQNLNQTDVQRAKNLEDILRNLGPKY
jgi:hypothetical protein